MRRVFSNLRTYADNSCQQGNIIDFNLTLYTHIYRGVHIPSSMANGRQGVILRAPRVKVKTLIKACREGWGDNLKRCNTSETTS